VAIANQRNIHITEVMHQSKCPSEIKADLKFERWKRNPTVVISAAIDRPVLLFLPKFRPKCNYVICSQ